MSGLLALNATHNTYRERTLSLIAIPQPRLMSQFVLADLDYLITRDAGAHHARMLLADIERGVYSLKHFGGEDIARAREIMERHADLEIGLAGASIVVLAERYGCVGVLTTISGTSER